MHLSQRHIYLAIIQAILWTGGIQSTALAQETPTPTPLSTTLTPTEAQFVLPPGDTTILVIGAVFLVLIILGAAVWSSKRSN
ncbi:MAG: hypothetical protein MUC85_09830 [Anaerolineales bacterium]|jgi:hypothetical protein|nr:hypothetical protein [Anaerolineales bacterium]